MSGPVNWRGVAWAVGDAVEAGFTGVLVQACPGVVTVFGGRHAGRAVTFFTTSM